MLTGGTGTGPEPPSCLKTSLIIVYAHHHLGYKERKGEISDVRNQINNYSCLNNFLEYLKIPKLLNYHYEKVNSEYTQSY